ncbi:MAG: hypothetical protein RIT81_33825 [Deltaproteobacteria bacterium]
MRRAAPALLVLCVACGRVDLPRAPAPDDARSEILLVGDDEKATHAFATDPRAPTTFGPIDVPGARRAEVFFLADSLEARGLRPGAIGFEGEAVTPIGALTIDLDPPGAWRSDPPQWATNLRVPAFDANRCLDEGVCIEDRYCRACTFEGPEAPVAPMRPRGRCPEGWTAELDAGFTFCRPFAAVPESCPAGTGRYPGEEGCSVVGPPCPADGWPSAPLNGDVIYLTARASAAPANGTRAEPYVDFSSVDERLRNGFVGTVALDTGVHDFGAAAIGTPLRVVGACAEAVISGNLRLTSTSTIEAVGLGGTIEAHDDLTLRDVRIEADAPGTTGRSVFLDGGTLHLERFHAFTNRSAAVVEVGADLDARDIYIGPGEGVGIQTRADKGRLTNVVIHGREGRGIQVGLSRDTELSNVALIGLGDHGLRVFQGTVTARDVWVADHRRSAALSAGEDGTLVVRGAWIERSIDGDFHAEDGGELEVEDAVVRDSGPALDDGSATQSVVLIIDDAHADVRRMAVLRPKRTVVQPVRASASVIDLFVVDHEDDGLEVNTGELELRRADLRGAASGVCGGREKSSLRSKNGRFVIEDVSIVATSAPGITIQEVLIDDAELQSTELLRVRVERRATFAGQCQNPAVRLAGSWTMTARDLDVRHEGGTAIGIAAPALTLSHTRITDSAIGLRSEVVIDPYKILDRVRFERNGVNVDDASR